MLGAKLIIKPRKKGELRERSPSYADFLPSILMVTGLRIFMISQATTSKKFWKKVVTLVDLKKSTPFLQ
jgi:hypothetical protein